MIICFTKWLNYPLKSFGVKQIKGDNGRNLSDMKINWETAFNSVTELTDSVLSKTQTALGPYLSTAFGLVKNAFKNRQIIMI